MPRHENQPDIFFNTTVDDELYEELAQLQGEEIVHVAVWEDSMAEGIVGAGGEPPAGDTFDMDLYLGGGVYFELYSVAGFDDPEDEPYDDRDILQVRLRKIVAAGATLGEIAVDEDDSLVLVLNQGRKAAIYLAVGGWVLEEWDELPV